MPRNHLDLVPTAARSLQTILEISDHVSQGSLRQEVANTVKGLFDLLAWSDGDLSLQEIALLDRLCEAVPDFTELCDAHDVYEPTDPTFGEIPRLLTAVVEHDRDTAMGCDQKLLALDVGMLATNIVAGNTVDQKDAARGERKPPVHLDGGEAPAHVGEMR